MQGECEVCRGECEVCRGECEVCTTFPQLGINNHITSVHKCAIMCVDACVHVLKECCMFSVHHCEVMYKVPLCSSQRNVTSPLLKTFCLVISPPDSTFSRGKGSGDY